MKEFLKIILSFIVWSVGAVFMLGLLVSIAVFDFFKDFSERTDNGGDRWSNEKNE